MTVPVGGVVPKFASVSSRDAFVIDGVEFHFTNISRQDKEDLKSKIAELSLPEKFKEKAFLVLDLLHKELEALDELFHICFSSVYQTKNLKLFEEAFDIILSHQDKFQPQQLLDLICNLGSGVTENHSQLAIMEISEYTKENLKVLGKILNLKLPKGVKHNLDLYLGLIYDDNLTSDKLKDYIFKHAIKKKLDVTFYQELKSCEELILSDATPVGINKEFRDADEKTKIKILMKCCDCLKDLRGDVILYGELINVWRFYFKFSEHEESLAKHIECLGENYRKPEEKGLIESGFYQLLLKKLAIDSDRLPVKNIKEAFKLADRFFASLNEISKNRNVPIDRLIERIDFNYTE